MYAIVAGGGKVGSNVARSLLAMGHEVTLIEQRPYRFEQLQDEFEHQVLLGDATELHVLERAGIARPPDLVLGVTGDDEDNLIICQLASEGYRVPKVIARVNDPRNQEHFDLLGITQTVCATSNVLGLVEHEVPEHGIVHLLELRKENLEIVELQIERDSPAASTWSPSSSRAKRTSSAGSCSSADQRGCGIRGADPASRNIPRGVASRPRLAVDERFCITRSSSSGVRAARRSGSPRGGRATSGSSSRSSRRR